MYRGDWLPRLLQGRRQIAAPGAVAWRVPSTVWALGLTSLLTDVSSEMVVSILPVYLVLTGGFAPLLLGVATGLHEGGPLLVTWLGGWAADRTGRRKLTAGAGYALSAVCRLGWLLLPPHTTGTLAALIVSDRLGKAIRTAPRDALISLSARPETLATAFGVHRALDAAGAAAGPVLAFLLLWQFPHRFDIIFFTAFIVALLGVAALFLLVDESSRPGSSTVDAELQQADANDDAGTSRVWSQAFAQFAASRPLRLSLLLGAAFGLLTIGDAFVYLLILQKADAPAHWLPLFYSGTAVMFLLTAVPMGALADRVGRWRVFVLGHLPLALAYLLALAPASIAAAVWPWNALAGVLLLGLFYASTDGVLAGLAGGLLPASVRAMGLAWVETAVSLGRLCGAILFGLLWTRAGDRPALIAFILAIGCLMTVGVAALWRDDAPIAPAGARP